MVENKELRAYKAGMRSDKHKTHRRHAKREIHVIPDVLAIGAVAVPVTTVRDGWGENPVQMAMSGDLSGALNQAVANTVTQWKPEAEFLIASFVAKAIGKKLGLNHLGTKGVKLF